MAKRKTGLSPAKFKKHPHKTAKRLAAKHAMLTAKNSKKSKNKSR